MSADNSRHIYEVTGTSRALSLTIAGLHHAFELTLLELARLHKPQSSRWLDDIEGKITAHLDSPFAKSVTQPVDHSDLRQCLDIIRETFARHRALDKTTPAEH